MTKKLFLLVTLVALSFQIASCTSSKSQDESEVVENADIDKIEAENTLTDEGIDSSLGEDPTMQAALGESAPPADAEVTADPATDMATTDTSSDLPTDVASAPTLDESSLNDVPPPADGSSEPAPNLADVTTEPAPSIDVAEAAPPLGAMEPPMVENSGTTTAMADVPATPKAGESLKKIAETMPYQTPKGWVNTVYVARPGETLKDISQKIFAADKVKDLKKIAENNYLKWRSVKAGDKIYYISPNRPDDSAKTLLYFEDMGMVPETYVAKKGDNLKKVAKEILGYKKAYVEMWTANPVESKAKLNEGEVLRYWRSASGVTSAMASNNPPPMNGAAQLIDQSQAQQYTPPPQAEAQMQPPQNMEMPAPPADSMASLPPPPGMEQPMPAMDAPPADATASLPPPPPPPPAEMAPPPVDEMAAATKPKAKESEGGEVTEEVGALDNDTMMSLGAVGVLTAALAFALIRRKKKKAAEMAAAMNETHVGS